MAKLSATGVFRRFSLGGPLPPSETIAAWKFDAVLRTTTQADVRVTCYVGCAARGDAFALLFAKWPGAQIFGTGLPLTGAELAADVVGHLPMGEVRTIDELGQLVS